MPQSLQYRQPEKIFQLAVICAVPRDASDISVLQNHGNELKKDFAYHGRNKRPPADSVNALLSFVYTLLTNTITSALETVGLDPYMGYLHTDRPGRASLSLDLIEELRAILADRFVLTLINK